MRKTAIKRLMSMMVVLAMLSVCLVTPAAFADNSSLPDNVFASEVSVSAQTAAVIDVDSGRILYGKNMNQRMRIASLTKIITAILAIESGKMDEVVTVSSNAAGKEGSSIYLATGEKLKLSDLVYAIMLRSGNDAATAIAEHVAGSTAKFADLMNQKIQQLGLTGTHFTNPHGLDNDNHYSTAHDMAILTAYALKNPTFRQIVATEQFSIPWQGREYDRSMNNKNKMLDRYEGADGVKTGYTKLAGRCLATSATKNGEQLAVIVLNDPNDWVDSASLLDYGFTKYHQSPAVVAGQKVADVQVDGGMAAAVPGIAASSFSYPVRDGEQQVRTEVKLPASVKAPVNKDQILGQVEVYQGQNLLVSIPVKSSTAVDRKTLWDRLRGVWQTVWR